MITSLTETNTIITVLIALSSDNDNCGLGIAHYNNDITDSKVSVFLCHLGPYSHPR